MTKSKNKKKMGKKNKNIFDHSHQMPVSQLKNNSPSISVCMIVKDEEQFLDNCLQSVKDIAEEIIIIDTGSKDNSVNIAKKYTDKIYFHPWKDSFSEARNHYFEYAKGTWIFQIDADEELVKEDIPALLKALKNPGTDAILVQIISHLHGNQFEGRHNIVRLFRNNGIIHYEGRIHERLSGIKAPHISPVHLMHHGYDLDGTDLSEMKHEKRVKLLKMDIQDQPDNPIPYHYLSCCYITNSLFKETLETSLKALELSEKKNDRDPLFLWTRYNAAMAYYNLKDFKNAEAIALSSLAMDSRHLDSHYLLTVIYFDQSKWLEVIQHAREYLRLSTKLQKNPEDFGIIVINSLNESWKMLVLMGIAYFETGNLEESAKSFQSGISNPSNPLYALRTIGIYYYKKGLFPEAREYLKKAFDINREDATVNDLLAKTGTEQQYKQTISCCMIVKNEEEFLEKCLLSIKNHVDEIVIVDTGSTDNTVEIARRFTDKVYFHPWESSFSKARNQALQYAKGNWIFQIDADEELMHGSGDLMRWAVMAAEDSDIIYIKVYSGYADGTQKSFHNSERLFRNNGIIHYEGNIHEQVVGGTKAFSSSIMLWHYGYDVDKNKTQEKFIRNVELLKKEIQKDPENPTHHHYLGLSFYSRGMNEEAAIEAAKAIEFSASQKNNSNLYAWSHFIASMAYYRMGRLKEAREYAEKSLNKYSEHMDACYILTIIAADEKKWDDVIRYGNTFLELLERIENKNGNVISGHAMNQAPFINLLIGHAYYTNNSIERMESFYKKAYKLADEKWSTWLDIGVYHMNKSGDLKLAKSYLTLAANEAPHEQRVWYMLAKLNIKLDLTKKELECLQKVVSLGTDDPIIFDRLLSLYIKEAMPDKALEIILNHEHKIKATGAMLCKIAILYMENGRPESAIKCYTMALERDSRLFEAWASLGEIMLGMNKTADAKIFFEKALSVANNDTGTILSLCDIASREKELLSIIKYCDLLLKVLKLPHNKTLNNLNDLKSILEEISSSLKENPYYQNQINAITDRISQMQNELGQ